MKFDLNDDQALLKSSTREMLESEAPLSESRTIMEDNPEGLSKKLYSEFGELGYSSLLLSEEKGGMGAIAFAVVLAEMGRVALPGPFLDLTLAARVLEGCADEAASRWCDSVSSGEKIVLLARSEGLRSADPAPPAASFEAGRVRGVKTFVPFGASADALLVETQQGIVLVERPDAGWDATAQSTFDHSQRFAQIAFDAPGTLVSEGAAAASLLADANRLGSLGAAAMMLGAMERSLELAVEYTSEREAFGVPIASFQALQHRAADMFIKTESTRSSVFRAAWAEENASADAAYLVSVAKAWAGPAGRFVCGQAIQLHGGVGFTWEYDLHIHLKRVKTLEIFHGSTRSQVEATLAASAEYRASA
jgi:alkylation response protein AidB-like acyl-CoA dehydrogenase